MTGTMKYVKIGLLLIALVLSSYVLLVSSLFSLGSEEAFEATMQEGAWSFVFSRIFVNLFVSMILALAFLAIRAGVFILWGKDDAVLDSSTVLYMAGVVILAIILPVILNSDYL
jgi:hypothetical protein